MFRRVPLTIALAAAAWFAAGLHASGTQDLAESAFDAIDHPAIAYKAPSDDAVARLSRRLQDGSTTLTFDAAHGGYLPALLGALDIPVESQLAVFSRTSLQRNVISPQNPRAIYFNDSTFVALPRGGFIEIAAHDSRQGVIFYVLPQQELEVPVFVRRDQCLTCHYSYAALGVPGLLNRSVVTSAAGDAMPFLGNYTTDDRSPLEERWAGWFVTGSTGSARHLGNSTVTPGTGAEVASHASALPGIPGDLTGYLSTQSDVVAHLVFDHETRVVNLLTRVGWEVRLATAENRDAAAVARRTARELVDALLFVDEAPLADGIEARSRFADAFAARGPVDRSGRSLRQFDLHGRLMRYPCSFMIYSEAFDALPAAARDAVYQRMWEILSGAEQGPRYSRLSASDRSAITEILRETKKGLPAYFVTTPQAMRAPALPAGSVA